jgi:thymidylate synthase
MHEEQLYLNLIQKIINEGEERTDRTGTGTYSLFGEKLEFDLRTGFPLLTTKKMFVRGIIEELLFFLRGQTDGQILLEKKVKIWEYYGSKKHFELSGIQREENDLGPIYGFNWRHFGCPYVDSKTDYEGQGIDQLQNVINEIKTNPFSRRLLISAWDPVSVKQAALPPCHVLFQFYVSKNKELSLQMYQRSADIGLGVPFNIASYSLLLMIVANMCNLTAKKLIISFGDVHVYKDHIVELKKQIERKPKPKPKMTIQKKIENFESLEFKDFLLTNYVYDNPIHLRLS